MNSISNKNKKERGWKKKQRELGETRHMHLDLQRRERMLFLQFLDLLWSGARGLAGPGWGYICHRDAKLLDLWLMYNSVYKRVHKFESRSWTQS